MPIPQDIIDAVHQSSDDGKTLHIKMHILYMREVFLKKLPTFRNAWLMLSVFVRLIVGKGPLYPTAFLILITSVMIFYNIHDRRGPARSWFDNSAHTLIDEQDEDAILGSVLEYIDSSIVRTDYAFFIYENTQRMSRDIEGLVDETALPYISLKQANLKPRILRPETVSRGNKNGKTRFIIFTQREHQKIFDGHWEDWVDFRQQYPQVAGIIILSRPGVDATGQAAIVDVGIMEDMLAGKGFLLKLQKSNGSWHVVRNFHTWIS